MPADERDQPGIDQGARPDEAIGVLLAFEPALDVDVVVVGDQPGRAADLDHDIVAGVDAQAAHDAFELRAVADVDAGRAHGDALVTIDAVAGRQALVAQLLGLLHRGARLAAVIAIGDVERPFVGQRRLDARPRAHVDAYLLAHEAGERVGGEGEHPDPQIGDERRLAGGELLHQGRRVGEIEHPGTAGPPGDHQPDGVLGDELERARNVELGLVLLHALAAVALDDALDRVEQVGPYRLWAQIAAPDAAADGVHQEQRHGGDDQEAGEIVDLLRPDLDEEEIEAPVGEIDQHRLARRGRPAVPAHERQQVVDAEAERHQPPFDSAEGAGDALRIDLGARRIERPVHGQFVRLDRLGHRRGTD